MIDVSRIVHKNSLIDRETRSFELISAKLVTRNVKDYEGLPIEVINPWAS